MASREGRARGTKQRRLTAGRRRRPRHVFSVKPFGRRWSSGGREEGTCRETATTTSHGRLRVTGPPSSNAFERVQRVNVPCNGRGPLARRLDLLGGSTTRAQRARASPCSQSCSGGPPLQGYPSATARVPDFLRPALRLVDDTRLALRLACRPVPYVPLSNASLVHGEPLAQRGCLAALQGRVARGPARSAETRLRSDPGRSRWSVIGDHRWAANTDHLGPRLRHLLALRGDGWREGLVLSHTPASRDGRSPSSRRMPRRIMVVRTGRRARDRTTNRRDLAGSREGLAPIGAAARTAGRCGVEPGTRVAMVVRKRGLEERIVRRVAG